MKKSHMHPPGIEPMLDRTERKPGPVRLLWCARWEHDKDFEFFAQAAQVLDESDFEFRVSVIGRSFDQVPQSFERFRNQMGHRIDRWGYLATRADYIEALSSQDMVGSTARHAFFGIAIVEAAEAGCIPIVPERLAYPEVLGQLESTCFYPDNATPATLAETIRQCADDRRENRINVPMDSVIDRYGWSALAATMDNALSGM